MNPPSSYMDIKISYKALKPKKLESDSHLDFEFWVFTQPRLEAKLTDLAVCWCIPVKIAPYFV